MVYCSPVSDILGLMDCWTFGRLDFPDHPDKPRGGLRAEALTPLCSHHPFLARDGVALID